MPYRAELKRPDLKGNFPCTVCGKVFCHSSSLSRHRMQAHFKSYTCTLCNQEISSNETLRSHMFRSHEISRMFMCRCCNWAFPDKTSLHIHMQSMMRHGQPGDVNILAKSSTDDGPVPPSPNTLATATMEPDARGPPAIPPSALGDLFGSPKAALTLPTSLASATPPSGIFPSMPSREELLNRMRGGPSPARPFGMGLPAPGQLQAALAAMSASGNSGAGNLLSAWLANNFQAAMGNAGGSPTRVPTSLGCGLDGSLNLADPRAPDDSSVFSDDGILPSSYPDTTLSGSLRRTLSGVGGLEIHLGPEDGSEGGEKEGLDRKDSVPSNGDELSSPKPEPADPDDPALPVQLHSNPLNSLLYKKKLSSTLRGPGKAKGTGLADFLASRGNGGFLAANPGLLAKHEEVQLPVSETQVSPAASDSQSSSTGAAQSDGSSPTKCYECQVTKGKLLVGENRNRFLESKVGSLEAKISRLEARVAGYEANARRYEGEQKGLREQCETLERKLLNCQEKALRYLQDSNNNGPNGNLVLMKELLEELLQTPTFDGFGYSQDESPLAKKPRICA